MPRLMHACRLPRRMRSKSAGAASRVSRVRGGAAWSLDDFRVEGSLAVSAK